MINSATIHSWADGRQANGVAIPNSLSKYASYNYIITLSALSSNEINFPEQTYRHQPAQGIILRSGGSGSSKITSEQEDQLGIITDLYIDDLEIYSLIGNNPDTRTATALTANFTVYEPYSMGMFLEAIAISAKNKGHDNHVGAPFLITIEFIGWDSDAQLVEMPELKRYIPIRFLDVKFTVNETGSKYDVETIVWQDQGFADSVQTTKQRTVIYGETLNEILQTGPDSLASILNHREQTLVKDLGSKKNADEYVILFPDGRSLGGGGGGQPVDPVTHVFGAHDVNNPSGDVHGELQKNEGYGLSTGTIGDYLRGIAESTANDIGLSKVSESIISSGRGYFNRPAFVENEQNPGLFKRDKILSNKEGTRLVFEEGQRITDIIEEIVLLSEYGKKFVDSEEDEYGMKKWFRIESNVFLDDSQGVQKPKVYVYKVVPYGVGAPKDPTQPFSGTDSLKQQAIKEYNYIYTGKNDSVISFEIDINYAYLASLQHGVFKSNDNQLPDLRTELPDELPEFEERIEGETPKEGAYVVGEVPAPNTGGTGGLDIYNNQESQISRSFSDMITNGMDLISLDLTVIGDPYFLSDTGMGNYTAPESNLINITQDQTMDYQYSQVDILVNFRTAADYGEDGIMMFPGEGNSSTYIFSGLYTVLAVTNKFSKGQFTQELDLIRRHHQIGSSSDNILVSEK